MTDVGELGENNKERTSLLNMPDLFSVQVGFVIVNVPTVHQS